MTRDGVSTFAAAVRDHPRRAEIEAHEAIHRAQFAARGERPIGTSRQLEGEAEHGAQLLRFRSPSSGGRPDTATTASSPASVPSFIPRFAAPAGLSLFYRPSEEEREGELTGQTVAKLGQTRIVARELIIPPPGESDLSEQDLLNYASMVVRQRKLPGAIVVSADRHNDDALGPGLEVYAVEREDGRDIEPFVRVGQNRANLWIEAAHDRTLYVVTRTGEVYDPFGTREADPTRLYHHPAKEARDLIGKYRDGEVELSDDEAWALYLLAIRNAALGSIEDTVDRLDELEVELLRRWGRGDTVPLDVLRMMYEADRAFETVITLLETHQERLAAARRKSGSLVVSYAAPLGNDDPRDEVVTGNYTVLRQDLARTLAEVRAAQSMHRSGMTPNTPNARIAALVGPMLYHIDPTLLGGASAGPEGDQRLIEAMLGVIGRTRGKMMQLRNEVVEGEVEPLQLDRLVSSTREALGLRSSADFLGPRKDRFNEIVNERTALVGLEELGKGQVQGLLVGTALALGSVLTGGGMFAVGLLWLAEAGVSLAFLAAAYRHYERSQAHYDEANAAIDPQAAWDAFVMQAVMTACEIVVGGVGAFKEMKAGALAKRLELDQPPRKTTGATGHRGAEDLGPEPPRGGKAKARQVGQHAELGEPVHVEIGGEAHHLFGRDRGRFEIWMCSARCRRLIDTIDEVLGDAALDPVKERQLSALRARLERAERRFEAGEVSTEGLESLLGAEVAPTLRKLLQGEDVAGMDLASALLFADKRRRIERLGETAMVARQEADQIPGIVAKLLENRRSGRRSIDLDLLTPQEREILGDAFPLDDLATLTIAEVRRGEGILGRESAKLMRLQEKEIASLKVMSVPLVAKLRGATPSARARSLVLRASKGLDQLTGAKPRSGELHADHLVPFREIVDDPRFQALGWDDQVRLLNDPRILAAIDSRANVIRQDVPWMQWGRRREFYTDSELAHAVRLTERARSVLSREIERALDPMRRQGR